MAIQDQIQDLIDQKILPELAPLVKAAVATKIEDILTDEHLGNAAEKLAADQIQATRTQLFGEVPEAPLYPNVITFVVKELCPMYGLTFGRKPNWSSEWYNHPEAIKRFTAMWHVFEKLRLQDPVAYQETFLRWHGDYHMDRLMQPGGVFADCKNTDSPAIPLETKPVSLKEDSK